MIKTREDYNKVIEKLKELVNKWGLCSVYMVGGCVRDEILGLLPKDIDLVVNYPGGSEVFVDFLKDEFSDICSGFTKYPKYGTSKFTLCYDTDSFIDIECVIPRTESYDNCFRKPSSVKYTTIEEDALRRDFCCNALYKNILTGEILDPTNKGLDDIKNKILRTPLDPIQTFKDDPLRMLRAIRFYCNKSFKIDDTVYSNLAPIQEFYGLSMERIRDEFEKILMSPNPIEGVNMLYNLKFLPWIIPDLPMCFNYNQNSKYHDLTLEKHIFRVLKGVMNVDKEYELELRWAALLHDIGKPLVAVVDHISGYTHYYDHDIKSSERTRVLLTRLKYGNDFIDRVCIIIENHMCIKQLYNYDTRQYTGKPSKTRKLALKLGDLLRPTMELIDSDNKAHAPEYCMDNQVKSFWESYEKYVVNSNITKNVVEDLISGNEIITTFNLTPGKNIGDIKQIIQNIYLENLTLTKEEIISKLKKETDNIELWISRDVNGYKVSITEPIFITILNLYSLQPDGDNFGELEYDYFNLELNTKTKVRAIECMSIYRELKDRKRVEKIIQQINNLAQSLLEVSSFQSVEIGYDTADHFAASVYWKNGKTSTYDG